MYSKLSRSEKNNLNLNENEKKKEKEERKRPNEEQVEAETIKRNTKEREWRSKGKTVFSGGTFTFPSAL